MKLTPTIAKSRYSKQAGSPAGKSRAEASAERVVALGTEAKKNWDDGIRALPDGAFKRSLAEH